MPPRRKTSRPRISKRFAAIMKEEEKIETDLRFWMVHVLHWHALLFAIIGILTIGYTKSHY